MDQTIERCAGLDVHKKTIAACARAPGERGERRQEIRTFGTTAGEIIVLGDWLAAHGVTHVAMESTGVYWKSVFYALEDRFEVLVVNAAHIKQVPGRKTDVKDCAWIAQLLEHGLLRGSFVPPAAIRELRDLTRYRAAMIGERSRVANRLEKVLEDAGIKLAAVVSEVLGVSGRAILEALVGGTTDPEVLADLARGTLRKKIPALQAALRGKFRPHHGFMVGEQLAHLGYLDEAIERLSAEVGKQLRPFAEIQSRVRTIPGIAERGSEVLIAEIGVDMERFPTASHLASWAGLCPGHHESAGRHTSGRPRKGDRWLRSTLTQTALAATQEKRPTALSARYRRLRGRLGHKKAILAIAHAQLRAAYYIIKDGVDYRDLGPSYYDDRYRERAKRRALRILEEQGYRVVLEQAA